MGNFNQMLSRLMDQANDQRIVVDQSSESGWSAIAGGALSPSEDPTL